MKRKFKFEYPEGIEFNEAQQKFINDTIIQHEEFVKGGFKDFVSAEEVETKIQEAITASKTKRSESKKTHADDVKGLLPTNTQDHELKYLTKLVKFEKDDTEEQKKEKLSTIAKQLNFDLGEDFLKDQKEETTKVVKELSFDEMNIENNL